MHKKLLNVSSRDGSASHMFDIIPFGQVNDAIEQLRRVSFKPPVGVNSVR